MEHVFDRLCIKLNHILCMNTKLDSIPHKSVEKVDNDCHKCKLESCMCPFMSEMYKKTGNTSSKPWKQHHCNTFGDIFSIFYGSNSPFRRRWVNNALFYQETKKTFFFFFWKRKLIKVAQLLQQNVRISKAMCCFHKPI